MKTIRAERFLEQHERLVGQQRKKLITWEAACEFAEHYANYAPEASRAASSGRTDVFTPGEVHSLNGYQLSGKMHPFTCKCGADLVATTRGWICLLCDYTQDWAHDWMKDWRWKKDATPAESASLGWGHNMRLKPGYKANYACTKCGADMVGDPKAEHPCPASASLGQGAQGPGEQDGSWMEGYECGLREGRARLREEQR